MANKTEVITNFIKQTGKCKNGSRSNGGDWGGGGHGGYNIFYEGRVLYSYGHHFPLAIRHFDADVENAVCFGEGVKYLVNGDKYSSSTSSHQSEVIQACKPNVHIPFSALMEAWNWAMGEDKPYSKVRSAESLVREFLDMQDWGFKIVNYRSDTWHYQGVDEDGKPLTPWMTAEEEHEHRKPYYEQHKDCPCASHKTQHRLGAVLFTIRNHSFLSSFDEQDTRNYFLCQVPGSPGTVEEAYEALKPEKVKVAEAYKGEVLRQGDWFFVRPFSVSSETLNKWVKQASSREQSQYRLNGSDGTHVVTKARIEVEFTLPLMVKGTVKHSPLDNRRPEHKRLKLGNGKSWWIPVKNTSEAGWGAVGNVD